MNRTTRTPKPVAKARVKERAKAKAKAKERARERVKEGRGEGTGEPDDGESDSSVESDVEGEDCDDETPVSLYISPDDSNSMASPVSREWPSSRDDTTCVTYRCAPGSS